MTNDSLALNSTQTKFINNSNAQMRDSESKQITSFDWKENFMALLAIKVVSTRSSLSKYWHTDFFEQMSMHGMVGMKKLESGDDGKRANGALSQFFFEISNIFLCWTCSQFPDILGSICLNSTHTFRHFYFIFVWLS